MPQAVVSGGAHNVSLCLAVIIKALEQRTQRRYSSSNAQQYLIVFLMRERHMLCVNQTLRIASLYVSNLLPCSILYVIPHATPTKYEIVDLVRLNVLANGLLRHLALQELRLYILYLRRKALSAKVHSEGGIDKHISMK